jgi:hypothetical protein
LGKDIICRYGRVDAAKKEYVIITIFKNCTFDEVSGFLRKTGGYLNITLN